MGPPASGTHRRLHPLPPPRGPLPRPAQGTVFPALVCTLSAYLSVQEPEAIRLQRLYKMCLVIVCVFFLISANCIFRERGPEPQKEKQRRRKKARKKTPRKKIAVVREGGLTAESGSQGAGFEASLGIFSAPGGGGVRAPLYSQMKGQGRMEIPSLQQRLPLEPKLTSNFLRALD